MCKQDILVKLVHKSFIIYTELIIQLGANLICTQLIPTSRAMERKVATIRLTN